MATERSWEVRQDGKSWRRVVASPEPQGIVELAVDRDLLDEGSCDLLRRRRDPGSPDRRRPSPGSRR